MEYSKILEWVEGENIRGYELESNKCIADMIDNFLRDNKNVIKYTPCCAEVKTKENPTFEHWMLCNFEETSSGKFIDFNNGNVYKDKQVLKLKYNKTFEPII